MLPNAGAYRAFDTPGGSILLVRARTEDYAAFLICPYHAWSYLADGTLYGCPDMKDAEGFDKVENGLVPLRPEVWAGFVFANFREDGPSLLDCLGDLPTRTASHKLLRTRCT
jgi:choline monooxygenase